MVSLGPKTSYEPAAGYLVSSTIKSNNVLSFAMSKRENREQIPTEFNAQETLRTLRRQERIEGERREKTVSDFPQAAALGQVLKDLKFPADRTAIIRFVKESNKSESRELLSLVEKIEEREYKNVSEVAKSARLVQ